jgi:hypothetical protein
VPAGCPAASGGMPGVGLLACSPSGRRRKRAQRAAPRRVIASPPASRHLPRAPPRATRAPRPLRARAAEFGPAWVEATRLRSAAGTRIAADAPRAGRARLAWRFAPPAGAPSAPPAAFSRLLPPAVPDSKAIVGPVSGAEPPAGHTPGTNAVPSATALAAAGTAAGGVSSVAGGGSGGLALEGTASWAGAWTAVDIEAPAPSAGPSSIAAGSGSDAPASRPPAPPAAPPGSGAAAGGPPADAAGCCEASPSELPAVPAGAAPAASGRTLSGST